MLQTVRLCLLGIPQVLEDGRAVGGFKSRKALALLCYLAVRAQPLTRTHLADLFWGDQPEPQGRANLSRVLNNLTTLLPESILATRDTLQVAQGVFSLDTREFEELAAQGTAEALQAAAALYRDEFMAGLFLDDCPEFEVWLVGERERWQQRIVTVVERLVEHYQARQAWDKALPFAARRLDLTPWQEDAHRDMMHLLARSGQQSAALQQYETARRVLHEELGAEPGAETTALYEKIRAEQVSLAPRVLPPHNLPLQLTSFVGRETELARIAARMNNPDCRLLTLVGAGGIGKTRLALEAARNLLGTFPDGVFFVSLAPIGAGQVEFIVPAIANALEFKFAGPEDPKLQLLEYLRAKHMLLLLDNFEHLLDGVILPAEILQSAPSIKILVTSREPLDIQAEWVTRVEGLSYPSSSPSSPADRDDLSHYSAVQLFVERAQRADEYFSFNDETTPHIIRLTQIVEGMPLALELAAARTRTSAIAHIRAQVENNLDFLSTTMRDVESRHRSLRAVLDWSFGSLVEEERSLFQRLSVFAGSWTLEAAQNVCSDGIVTTIRVEPLLTQLVDKSLILREESEQAQRFRMLEPVSQFATERISSPDEKSRLRIRHLEFFLGLAEEFYINIRGAEQARWLDRLETEIDNLRLALAWTLETGSSELGLRLAGAIGPFWHFRGYYLEASQWFDKIFDMDSGSPTAARARALRLAAIPGTILDAPPAIVRARLESALLIYRHLNDREGITATLSNLAVLERKQNNLEAAEVLCTEALALRREDGDHWGMAISLNNLGLIKRYQGDLTSAQSMLEESLSIWRKIGDQGQLANTLTSLAEVLIEQRLTDAAAMCSAEGLAVARAISDKRMVAYLLENFAHIARLRDEHLRAVRLISAATALRTSLSAPLPALDADNLQALLNSERDQLGGTAFEQAWHEGHAMPFDQAIAYALQADKAQV